MATPRMTWRADAVVKMARKETERRMERATLFVQDQVKRSINRGNPRGDDPSQPGEPPKKVTGGLQGKINQRVDSSASEVVGYVGSNAEHARRLELGFTGTDSAGRAYRQGARPFLRPGLSGALRALRKIFGIR